MADGCTFGDCSEAQHAKGLCAKHYMRERRHGDPSVRLKTGPARSIEGEAVSYALAHWRVRAEYGPASEWDCVDCGKPAADWSYDGLDPLELHEPDCGPYSTNPAHYAPRCGSCHLAYDRR